MLLFFGCHCRDTVGVSNVAVDQSINPDLSKNLSSGTKMLSVTTGWRQISKYNFWRPIKRLKLYWQLWLRFLLNIRIKVKSEVRPHHSSPSKMHCHQKKVARAELFGLYLVFTMCSAQSVRSCDKMLCSVHCSAIEGYGVQSCTWQHLGTTLFYSGPVITLVIS